MSSISLTGGVSVIPLKNTRWWGSCVTAVGVADSIGYASLCPDLQQVIAVDKGFIARPSQPVVNDSLVWMYLHSGSTSKQTLKEVYY